MGSMADCRGPQVALFRCRSVPSRHCAAELQVTLLPSCPPTTMAGFKAVDCGLPSAKAIAQQCNERARRQARPNWKAPFWGHTPEPL